MEVQPKAQIKIILILYFLAELLKTIFSIMIMNLKKIRNNFWSNTWMQINLLI